MNKLNPEKIGLIDYACKTFRVTSFADLGGVWGVDGGYTFYTLENYKVDKAFLVDTNINEIVRNKQKAFPQLTLMNDNFGNYEVAQRLGEVDAIFLFDVLLHQVSPDWDTVIQIYSKHTRIYIVFNQQYIGSKTLRLIDLGEEEYFKNVPHTRQEEPYKSFIEKMYQIHPQHNRIYRDIHNVWQWGIVDKDLINAMKDQNFNKVYYKNYGQWGGLKNFEGHAFIFKKTE